jgi:hypothetical protein
MVTLCSSFVVYFLFCFYVVTWLLTGNALLFGVPTSLSPHRCCLAKSLSRMPGRDSKRGPDLRQASVLLSYSTVHTLIWASPHPNATPYPNLSYATPQSTPHPNAIRHTLIWATPHLTVNVLKSTVKRQFVLLTMFFLEPVRIILRWEN